MTLARLHRTLLHTIRIPKVITYPATAAMCLLLAAFVILPGLSVTAIWPGPDLYSRAVLTSSMAPDMPAGSQVVVQSLTEDELRTVQLGDVIAFMPDPGDTTAWIHRVVGIESNADGHVVFTTQGDALDQPDSVRVEPQMVIGKRLFHVPWFGHLTTSLNPWLDGQDRQSIITAAGILLGGYFVVLIASDVRRKLRTPKATALPEDTTTEDASPVPVGAVMRTPLQRHQPVAARAEKENPT